MTPKKPVAYRDAGVNIDEADRAVSAIRRLARTTFTPAVLTDIGSFMAAAFASKDFAIRCWCPPPTASEQN